VIRRHIQKAIQYAMIGRLQAKAAEQVLDVTKKGIVCNAFQKLP